MNGSDVDIDWESARRANQANWEDRVPVHEEAYGLEAFDDPDHLSDVVRDDLAAISAFLPSGGLSGLDLCHLQCHIGTDTVSLARAGARVTGVDFSPSALHTAGELATRLGVEATWVETDVLDARAAVVGDFDVVYTSIGTITWLDDLDRWAAQIVALLRPGGMFFIRDGHPALYALDEDAVGLTTRYPYFATGHAQQWDDDSTYAGDGRISHAHLRVAPLVVRDPRRAAARRSTPLALRRGPDSAMAVQRPHGRGRRWLCLARGRTRSDAVHLHDHRPAGLRRLPRRPRAPGAPQVMRPYSSHTPT